MHDKPTICKSCGGKCCKAMPGPCFPDDFSYVSRFDIRSAIASGEYCIDWWEGDPRDDIDEDEKLPCTYFIRPAIKGSEGRIYHSAWGGECTFLRTHGCNINTDYRPSGCKHVVPDKTYKCNLDGSYDKKDAAIAWIPFQDMIEEIGQELTS